MATPYTQTDPIIDGLRAGRLTIRQVYDLIDQAQQDSAPAARP